MEDKPEQIVGAFLLLKPTLSESRFNIVLMVALALKVIVAIASVQFLFS